MLLAYPSTSPPLHGRSTTMKNQLKLVAAAIVAGFLVSASAPVSADDDWGISTHEQYNEMIEAILQGKEYRAGDYIHYGCEVSTSCARLATEADNAINTNRTTLAPVPALTGGMLAPTADVGLDAIHLGNAQYSNSAGYSDSFSVGTSTSIGSSVSASSTPDYDVRSEAIFGIGSSTIDQQIGTATAKGDSSNNTISDISEMADTITDTEVSKDFQRDTSTRGGWWWWNRRNNTRTHITDDEKSTIETQYRNDVLAEVTEKLESSSLMSGTISASFKNESSHDGRFEDFRIKDFEKNEVTVNGIGTEANIKAGNCSAFEAEIEKNGDFAYGAGTASGGASGNVGTTATVNANSSQFISSFGQAY